MSRKNKTSAMVALDELLSVMAALRQPVTGCPWDLEQTFETIAPYTIEEAYEVADAIQRGDPVDLKEELGDLLLQIVYHARIAEEQGLFSFADVAEAIIRKMIRRHPHVFGSPDERAAGAQPGFWEKIKAAEKTERAAQRAAAGLPEKPEEEKEGENVSVLSGVPRNMPALTRAIKLQDKAAKVGFDWPDPAPVLAKMREELAELDAALTEENSQSNPGPGQSGQTQAEAVYEEFGDLLFVMSNVARHLKIDPEDCLRQANLKFERRFRGIEQHLATKGRPITNATLNEMEAIWAEVKRQEKS